MSEISTDSNATKLNAGAAPNEPPDLTMAERVERFDWSSTPLGPKDQWPVSLRTAVGLCLASPVPSLVWWGPQLINIYNDAHAPQLADKHPGALGKPAAEVWAEIWPQMKDSVDAVMLRGESVVRERHRVEMKRKGFPDVMYFTFTHSPIPGEDGGVGGLFHIAIDETARVQAEADSKAANARLQQELKSARADAERRLAHWHTIVASMPEGVIIADTQGNLLDCNRAALEIMGDPDGTGDHRDIAGLRADVEVYDMRGNVIPFRDWCISKILRGETVRNEEVRVHRFNQSQDVLVVCNGTVIQDEGGQPQLVLLSMHDATERRRPTAADVHRRLSELDAAAAQHSADTAARSVEKLLDKMNLNPSEQAFVVSLGEHLVQNAIDTYLMTNQQTHKYDGSCIAASLAVAMIIAHDV